MQNVGYHLLLLLLRLVALLPLPVLYVVSDAVSWLLRRVIKYRVGVVRRNLQGAFPEKSAEELQAIERGFYRHLGDCFVETVKLLHISDREMARRVEVCNAQLIDRLSADGRPFVILLGHYGNWEWVQEVTRYYNPAIVNGELYRPQHSPVFNRLMITIRSRYDTVLITQRKAVRTLIGMHREGKQFLIGFIADQRPNSKNLNHWTRWLNQDTPIAVGGEEIGRHVGAHFVYLDIEKPRRGHYRMTFKALEPSDALPDYPYTAAFLQSLETTIRRAPQYWLWSHNRWKYRRPEGK